MCSSDLCGTGVRIAVVEQLDGDVSAGVPAVEPEAQAVVWAPVLPDREVTSEPGIRASSGDLLSVVGPAVEGRGVRVAGQRSLVQPEVERSGERRVGEECGGGGAALSGR